MGNKEAANQFAGSSKNLLRPLQTGASAASTHLDHPFIDERRLNHPLDYKGIKCSGETKKRPYYQQRSTTPHYRGVNEPQSAPTG